MPGMWIFQIQENASILLDTILVYWELVEILYINLT